MKDVYEPQGPLPSEVYWRRRIAAIAGGVLVVVAVVALIVVIAKSIGGGDSSDATPAANRSSTTASTTAEASQSDPNDKNNGGSVGGSGGGAQESTSAPASTPPAESSAPATSSAAAGSNGTAQCADGQLSVVLYTDKPTYTRGDQPTFTLVVTNGGLAACSRDVGKAAQNVVVRSLDGARTLWSAQDCGKDDTVNNQVLAPGQQVRDEISWSFTTSNPGCDKQRTQIPVGAYKAIGKFGERESAPVTFNVVAPAQN